MADDASATASFCPYVGLQPFTVEDRAYFFGREREQHIISANLFAAPLTVLYGPSAVGKSSVLQAGVIPRLAGELHTASAYFARWSGADYLERLRTECRERIVEAHGKPLTVDDRLPFDQWVEAAVKEFGGTFLLMLDQFEEYLLYHREDSASAFDADLARIINRGDAAVHVLIGLRDDSLSRLNRFSRRIPNLLGNSLQLRRLSPEAARRAICGPIEQYNATRGAQSPARIDDPLVDRIIRDVMVENVRATVSGGVGGLHDAEEQGHIETAFLQLVLTEIWHAAKMDGGARVLDAATLDALGGARAIVRRHIDREIARLSDGGREIAARLFQHLVTPSGTKYALRTEDLVVIAERPAEEVAAVLKSLSEARLLRRMDPPERYEIFHDAFAAGLLEWRKKFLQERQQSEALREAEAQRRAEEQERSRKRRLQTTLAAGILLLAALAGYLLHMRNERRELQANLAVSEAALLKANAAAEESLSARNQAEASERLRLSEIEQRELTLQADRARLEGDAVRARQLTAQAAEKEAAARRYEADLARYKQESAAKAEVSKQAQVRLDSAIGNAKNAGVAVPAVKTDEPAAAPYTSPPAPPAPPAVPEGPPKSEAIPAAPNNSVVTTPTARDYRDAYRRALSARDRKRWSEAQSLLESAIAANPNETGEPINLSGFGNVEPYVPHYYLGVVLVQASRNNCPRALEEFTKSEQAQAIQKTGLFRSLQQRRRECEAR